ncbi:hypothetical protein GX586_16280 [bacterium]|nr:hypothetical protein [bacterium]
MKIDLEKELMAGGFPPRRSFWLPAIAGLCFVNLLLAAVALHVSVRTAHRQPPELPFVADTNVILTVPMTQRISSLERSVRDLRASMKQSQKEIRVATAEQAVEKKRERMGDRAIRKSADIVTAPAPAPVARRSPAEVVALSQEQKLALDQMVDEDDSGAQVRSFLASLTNAAVQNACIEYLMAKGDQWLTAATQLPADATDDAEVYLDNAEYFYDVVSGVVNDTAVIAYIATKRNAIQLARQQRAMVAAQQEQAALQEETKAELEERFTPRETAQEAFERMRRDRRRTIFDYPSSGTVRPYQTDWDPDPRVREERGLEH